MEYTIGDMIVMKESAPYNITRGGARGIIIEIGDDNEYYVKFMRSTLPDVPSDDTFWVNSKHFTLLSAAAKLDVRFGMRVRIINGEGSGCDGVVTCTHPDDDNEYKIAFDDGRGGDFNFYDRTDFVVLPDDNNNARALESEIARLNEKIARDAEHTREIYEDARLIGAELADLKIKYVDLQTRMSSLLDILTRQQLIALITI